jgi:putrescine aminotransferase
MPESTYAARKELFARHINGPYVQFLRRMGLDLDAKSAAGAVVFDASGKRYIDCIAGYGNCVLGHNHPAVTDAVIEELRSPRPFNLPFIQDAQTQLAQTLAQVTPGDLECSFLVNSGSEAVETALKLVRLSTGKPGVICMEGAWHGFTAGCLSISEPSMLKGFSPLLEHVKHVPYDNLAAIDGAIDDSVGCLIVEPIQAENGAVMPGAGYLQAVADLCRRRGVLLVFDEVKTGIAKTGALFACQREGAVPDILVCGKALGGGVMPIGAVVARRPVWSKFGFSFPMSSSSGAGNAPACAAALATLKAVADEKLCDQAERKGGRLRARLVQLMAAFPQTVVGVTGAGLLLSLNLGNPKTALDIISRCAQEGVLVMHAFCARSKILVEPPVVISDEDIEQVANALAKAVAACNAS